MMSPKLKMFLIHAALFMGVFIITRYILAQFMNPDDYWVTIIAVACAWIIAPRPHIIQNESGRQYGLRILFTKKIYWL